MIPPRNVGTARSPEAGCARYARSIQHDRYNLLLLEGFNKAPQPDREVVSDTENSGETLPQYVERRAALAAPFVTYYNLQRPNQALNNRTPVEEMLIYTEPDSFLSLSKYNYYYEKLSCVAA